MAGPAYVDINRVVDFVDRTVAHGAPLRVAYARAERRFKLPRHIVKALYAGSFQ